MKKRLLSAFLAIALIVSVGCIDNVRTSADGKSYGAIAKLSDKYEYDNVYISYNNGKQLICAIKYTDYNFYGYIFDLNGKLIKILKGRDVSVQCNAKGETEIVVDGDEGDEFYNEKGEKINDIDDGSSIFYYNLSDYWHGGIEYNDHYDYYEKKGDSWLHDKGKVVQNYDEDIYQFVDSHNNKSYLYPMDIGGYSAMLMRYVTPDIYWFLIADGVGKSCALVKYDGTIISNNTTNNTPFVSKGNNNIYANCDNEVKVFTYEGDYIKSICKDLKSNSSIMPIGSNKMAIREFDSGDFFTQKVTSARIVDLDGKDITKGFNNFSNISVSTSDDYFAAKSGGSWYLFKYGESDKVKVEEDNPNKNTPTKSINNKKTAIKKISVKKKTMKVTWKRIKGVAGYQIQYSLNKKFKKKNKTIKIGKASITSKTIKKLKRKKTYYVRIRTFIKVKGKVVYSAWSKAKAKKIK